MAPKDVRDIVLSTAELCELLNLRRDEIATLCKKGIFARVDHGKFNCSAAFRGYYAHLPEQIQKAECRAAASAGYRGAKQRLLEARELQAELTVAKKLAAVVDTEVVEKEWADHCAHARARLLAIPPMAAPLVVNKDIPTAFEVLTTLIHEALEELANIDDDETDEADAEQAVLAGI
jgi:phage terminase Nu1 subunit (DNA packaging protein)